MNTDVQVGGHTRAGVQQFSPDKDKDDKYLKMGWWYQAPDNEHLNISVLKTAWNDFLFILFILTLYLMCSLGF